MSARPSSGADTQALIERLERWANARDRRYAEDHRHRAHGKTGTTLLRDAAVALDVLGARVRELEARAETAENALEKAHIGLLDVIEFPEYAEFSPSWHFAEVRRIARAALAGSRPELELEP